MQKPATLPRALPNAERAAVGRRKARDYLLNPAHPEGQHKARVFRSALGYARNDWERLIADLEEAVKAGRVTGWRLGRDGSATWTVVVTVTGPNRRSADVQTRWRVTHVGNAPRLTTAFVDV